jgi:hypothetical protein
LPFYLIVSETLYTILDIKHLQSGRFRAMVDEKAVGFAVVIGRVVVVIEAYFTPASVTIGKLAASSAKAAAESGYTLAHLGHTCPSSRE